MLSELIKLYVKKRVDELANICDDETKDEYDRFLFLLYRLHKKAGELLSEDANELEHLFNTQKNHALSLAFETAFKEGMVFEKEISSFNEDTNKIIF